MNDSYKKHYDLVKDYTITNNYFVLSGLDGSGKTTQIELLKKRFECEGKKVYVFHHSICENSFFKTSLEYIYSNISFNNILQSDISYIIAFEYLGFFINKVLPKINESNSIVLLDRGINDLFVTQKTVYRNDFIKGLSLLEKINEKAIYFYLNVSPEICYSRLTERNEPLKPHESLPILQMKYQEYTNFIEQKKTNTIDGTKDKNTINSLIYNIVKNSL